MNDGWMARELNAIAVGKSPIARKIGSILHITAMVTASVFYYLIVSKFEGAIKAHCAAAGLGVVLVIPSKIIKDFLHGRRIIDVTRSSELQIYYIGIAKPDIFRRWINFSIASALLMIGLACGLALSLFG